MLAPHKEGLLKVSGTHSVYYAAYGNPKGKPVLVFHGGPGGISKAKHIFGYDLSKAYFVSFDQRGCGKSCPAGEIKDNTTGRLLQDAKKILDHLKIRKTAVVGGSWGAAMAFLFAQAYPEAVSRVFVRSTFAARKADEDFLFRGVREIYPDLNDAFMKHIPAKHRGNPAPYLLEKMENGSPRVKKEVAALIGNYEYRLMRPTIDWTDALDPDAMTLEDTFSARIFLHYAANDFFIKDGQIAKEAAKIKDIPVFMVHGRFDLDSPLSGAWEIHKALPGSKLTVVPYEGHIGDFQGELFRAAVNEWLTA